MLAGAAAATAKMAAAVPVAVAGSGLRVAFASDGHYAEKGTDYQENYAKIIRWLNQEHRVKPLDFVVFNGDIVHDQPDLLKTVRDDYFSRLKMPWYALPGNHDHATPSTWKEVFGYDVNYSIEKKNTAFIMANTSNEKGDYVCPDIDFLRTSLDKYKEIPAVFVVMHIPPHQWLPEENYFTRCDDVLKLLEGYPNLKGLFHGHDHSLDVMRRTGNLRHFFDGHFGGSWGTAYHGFRLLEIDETGRIGSFQKNPGAAPVINRQQL
ncbi:MAG: metallophosphoesterase [Flavihumibacter sp.]